jgi:hypothetical protein
MKSMQHAIPWVKELPMKVFTSRSTSNADSALPGKDKRVFRFLYGEEPSPEEPGASSPSSDIKPLNTKRLFCSRFIKVHQQ